MTTTLAAPPITACPRCGGNAPRGFLFCLACAVGMYEQDEGGQTLYDALAAEYEQLGQRIHDGQTILAELEYGPKRDRAMTKITQWKRQARGLAYVLNQWRVE